MPQKKIQVTKSHVDAVHKAVSLFESASDMANFLEINRTNVYLWTSGRQLIPLKHAQTLVDTFPEEFTVVTFRPDVLQYKKYL